MHSLSQVCLRVHRVYFMRTRIQRYSTSYGRFNREWGLVLGTPVSLIPSVVRDEPEIYPGRRAVFEETEGMSKPTDERGNLRIWKLRKHQTDCIQDVRITNLDAPSNIHRKPEAVLISHEREKKKEIPPSMPGPTPTLPWWFHVKECLEMKPS